MGKRKERRLAAKMASRRVKLDLVAEPSGESGGSSAQDELGGETDPRHRAGSPDSPSSSGKQSGNPLLLLGQYSDDELNENSSQGSDHATTGKSSAGDDEVKGLANAETADLENKSSLNADDQNNQPNLGTDSISQDALQKLEENDRGEIDSAVIGDVNKEEILTEEASVPGTSDAQVVGDVHSSWKVVLHEESNQYYYWNTITGETSWAVPDDLTQGNGLTSEQRTISNIEGKNHVVSGAQLSNSMKDVELHGTVTVHTSDYSKAADKIHDTQNMYEFGTQVVEQNNGYKHECSEEKTLGLDARQTEAKDGFGATDLHDHETSSLEDNITSQKSVGEADSEQYVCKSSLREDDKENDLWCSVLKHGEHLLERLKSMKSSRAQGHDWISKYVLEVEIRLSDIKSLVSFGTSLLPFWVHCERQLKQLEVSMEAEASQYPNHSQIFKAEAMPRSQEYEGIDVEADGNENKIVCFAFENSYTSTDADKSTAVQNDSSNLAANTNILHAEHASIINCPTYSRSLAGGKNEVHEAAGPAGVAPKTLNVDVEDEDMDVDMEVEDSTPANVIINQDSRAVNSFAPEEQPIQPNQPTESELFMHLEACGIPQPPDEDWIPPPPPENELVPPPPPDNELVPPPPPDEHPQTLFPPVPSYSETIQPLAYAEQYILSHPTSSFEYYGQTNTEYPATNIYAHNEGCQIAVPQPPVYYEAIPGTYLAAAPVAVSSVESVAYYAPQDGAVLPGQVVSGALSSGLNVESSREAFDHGEARCVDSSTDVVFSSVSSTEVGVSTVYGGTERVSTGIPSTTATIQAPVTTSVAESIPESSSAATATAAVAAKSTTSNVQPKASRGKKRTVSVVSTLRSNKKVSSLVDKWKAAKEELHEEEDEPENAYEILEKKRKREIEEWHAQQIASGEAKVNANFQPLGGDWRERVKRKKAQMESEAVETLSNDLTDGNQVPNLNDLSKGLPSGWQAYWDESSKQVYYGNAITSETTWTRPAK